MNIAGRGPSGPGISRCGYGLHATLPTRFHQHDSTATIVIIFALQHESTTASRSTGTWLGHVDSNQPQEQAVELLQELGLKEYEAKSFTALSRMASATAKDISETTDVPRTRVYDAIRVLEAKGLVEVQHSNPQRYRAVPIVEAVDSLEDLYEERMDTLRTALERLEPVENDEEISQEIWSLNGSTAIANRTRTLIESAAEEVVLVVGADEILTAQLVDALNDVPAGTDVIVGALTEELREQIRDAVPDAKVFVSGLEWLSEAEPDVNGDTAIGRLLLVDRQKILLSSIEPVDETELAIFGGGFGNGLVVIARRLMATGLVPAEDPGHS